MLGEMTMPQPPLERRPESPPATPRWVKLFAIVVLALIVLLVITALAGIGTHGPGRHMPSGHNGDPRGVVARQGLSL